jgi:hypothetical protein
MLTTWGSTKTPLPCSTTPPLDPHGHDSTPRLRTSTAHHHSSIRHSHFLEPSSRARPSRMWAEKRKRDSESYLVGHIGGAEMDLFPECELPSACHLTHTDPSRLTHAPTGWRKVIEIKQMRSMSYRRANAHLAQKRTMFKNEAPRQLAYRVTGSRFPTYYLPPMPDLDPLHPV